MENKNDIDSASKQIIQVGQKLFCKDGQHVIVKKISDDSIIIEYKNKIYIRGINYIGWKLFINDPFDLSNINKYQNTHKEKTVNRKILNSENFEKKRRTCSMCEEFVRGECFGDKHICKSFHESTVISKEEKENWPKYCDATQYSKYGSRYKK